MTRRSGWAERRSASGRCWSRTGEPTIAGSCSRASTPWWCTASACGRGFEVGPSARESRSSTRSWTPSMIRGSLRSRRLPPFGTSSAGRIGTPPGSSSNLVVIADASSARPPGSTTTSAVDGPLRRRCHRIGPSHRRVRGSARGPSSWRCCASQRRPGHAGTRRREIDLPTAGSQPGGCSAARRASDFPRDPAPRDPSSTRSRTSSPSAIRHYEPRSVWSTPARPYWWWIVDRLRPRLTASTSGSRPTHRAGPPGVVVAPAVEQGLVVVVPPLVAVVVAVVAPGRGPGGCRR